MKKKHVRDSLYFSVLAVFVAGLGVYFGISLYEYIHKQELNSLETRAKTIASFISPGDLATFSLSEADLYNPAYQKLKGKLTEIRSFYADTRFIYLITEKGGVAYFMVDSEDPESEDYSPPGQEYSEASLGVLKSLKEGVDVIEGPVSDRWGLWISSLVPIKDELGNTLAIVGIDIDASAHTTHLYTSIIFVAVATVLILLLIFVIYRMRKKEEEVVNLKSEFISLASHELRAPLTFIRWKLSNLLDAADLSDSLTLALREIKDAILKVITMSTSILETTASSYRVGDKKDLKKINIIKPIENAIKGVEGNRAQKAINISFSENSLKNTEALGEEDKLELAFTNLLSNAIKYSPDKSSIEISVKEEVREVVVCIKDHGMGIPPEELKYIFSGFYRAQNAKGSSARGSGFGLYMTKKIIEFLGGMIKCDSRVGEGTTFIVKLQKANG